MITCNALCPCNTNKQTNKQTNKHTNTQTHKQTNKHTNKQTHKQTNKQTNIAYIENKLQMEIDSFSVLARMIDIVYCLICLSQFMWNCLVHKLQCSILFFLAGRLQWPTNGISWIMAGSGVRSPPNFVNRHSSPLTKHVITWLRVDGASNSQTAWINV